MNKKKATENEEDTALELDADDDSAEDEEEQISEDEGEDESTSDEESEDEPIDYKAQLEIEKQRNDKLQTKLAGESFKQRENKRVAKEIDENEEEEDEDKPLTKREMREMFASMQKTGNADRINEIAGTIASNDDERELIVQIHANRSFPASMPIREQLEEAHAIANRKRLVSKNKELVRALNGKQNVSRVSAGGGSGRTENASPKKHAEIIRVMKRQGYVWDSSRGVLKKTVGKKTVYLDPATRKRTEVASK